MSAPLDIEGPAAPPRSNGELVFAEPWESRAFLAGDQDAAGQQRRLPPFDYLEPFACQGSP
ncbi:hypothetical protein [Streptomyces mirabilis]|uniref:hypothetical protein n=1 Tax=Streptomyces mirabilis TaxID=68239 RepID=UPI0036D118BA